MTRPTDLDSLLELIRKSGVVDEDRLNAPKVVVINEEAARRYFKDEDPIGKRVAVYQGGFHTGAEVIGIVGDVRFGTIDSAAAPDAFISYSQARLSRMMVFVRTSGDPSAIAPSVRAVVRRVAPNATILAFVHVSFRACSKNRASLGLEPGQPPSMKAKPSSSSFRAMRSLSSTE